jgi:hypothetical protein
MTDIEKTIGEARAELLPFESWERLPGETGAAYAAFCAYRDFGPDRNIRKAAEKTAPGTSPGAVAAKGAKLYRTWRQWSMRFQWLKRAADWDLYLDRMKQAEIRRTIEERGEAHRRVTDKMLQVVSKKLDMMEPGELTQGAVVDWVQTAINTERNVLGITASTDDKDKQSGTAGDMRFVPEFEGL